MNDPVSAGRCLRRRTLADAAVAAARTLARTEGIIPALESAHGVYEAIVRAPAAKGQIFIVSISGRGDKDIDIYRENMRELDQA